MADTENVPPTSSTSRQKPVVKSAKSKTAPSDRKKLQTLQPSGRNQKLLVRHLVVSDLFSSTVSRSEQTVNSGCRGGRRSQSRYSRTRLPPPPRRRRARKRGRFRPRLRPESRPPRWRKRTPPRPGPSRSCYCVILKWYFQIL